MFQVLSVLIFKKFSVDPYLDLQSSSYIFLCLVKIAITLGHVGV